MCAAGSQGRACPLDAGNHPGTRAHVQWTPTTPMGPGHTGTLELLVRASERAGRGSPGAPRRGRRDFLGRHDEGEGDDDVGVAGADGAHAVGAFHELAKGIRQAAVDPVTDHNARAERGTGEKLLGQGQRRTHQIIVERGACMTSG